MTDRLYYDDPYLREFDATVTAVEWRDNHAMVALDRTAFYPTSGGQPFDVGTLGSLRVIDVVDENGGPIMHVVPAICQRSSFSRSAPSAAAARTLSTRFCVPSTPMPTRSSRWPWPSRRIPVTSPCSFQHRGLRARSLPDPQTWRWRPTRCSPR